MGRYTGKRCRLLSMFGLTGSFFLVEIVVGYVTNSMALVADSFHMLRDTTHMTSSRWTPSPCYIQRCIVEQYPGRVR